MIKRTAIFLLILSAWLVGCEEEIQIDLREAGQELVIEGVLTDRSGTSFVRLSRTTDYFNPQDPPLVSGATVNIRHEDGTLYPMTEYSPGVYLNAGLRGMAGKGYTLEVNTGNNTYTGSSVMPLKTPIDSLVPEYFQGNRFADPAYFIHCFFSDSAGIRNYYRVRVQKGNQQSSVYYLLDDRLNDGRIIDFFLFGESFNPGDTAVVELLSLDFPAFDYYNTLSEVVGTGRQGVGSTPANPNSNLSPRVLGFFGAIAVARDTLIFPSVPVK